MSRKDRRAHRVRTQLVVTVTFHDNELIPDQDARDLYIERVMDACYPSPCGCETEGGFCLNITVEGQWRVSHEPTWEFQS